ncbi:hypothetical protein CEUSTIGMA_g11813.t1 [Chlamydomonas eustigma]|uniref:Uncharacterized protein n=1 Tax=Chlamydomonas eustigma TaxID=1157962 RepID=A0A250XMR1_9CHLO|nr:hypothetical protein CEUSTIGMA_g11813.t1 [Chlamydomonas eustigma]|eukprot:GAX84391.1 hypothetical protein CEUSTIGMA_g11813.t1 [Chlamydomonas eustigma]
MSESPSILLMVGALAGMARALIDKTRQKRKPRLTRTLTIEELQPLEDHVTKSYCADEATGNDITDIKHCRRPSTIIASAEITISVICLAIAAWSRAWLISVLLALLAALLVGESFFFQSLGESSNKDLRKGADSASSYGYPAEGSSAIKDQLGDLENESSCDQRLAVLSPSLCGTWLKVDHLSDSQDIAADMLQLGGLARAAMTMFKGMVISLTSSSMQTRALTKVPLLKVPTEVYDLSGGIRNYQRRDLRKGYFYGYLSTQPDGGLNMYYKWDEPHAGHCCDEMRLHGNDELHITTHLVVGHESCAYRVVYWRKGTRGSGETPSPSSSLASMMRSASQAALDVLKGFEQKPVSLPVLHPVVTSDKASDKFLASVRSSNLRPVATGIHPPEVNHLQGSQNMEGHVSDSCSESTAGSRTPHAGGRASIDSLDHNGVNTSSNEQGRPPRGRRMSGQRPFSRVLDM